MCPPSARSTAPWVTARTSAARAKVAASASSPEPGRPGAEDQLEGGRVARGPTDVGVHRRPEPVAWGARRSPLPSRRPVRPLPDGHGGEQLLLVREVLV